MDLASPFHRWFAIFIIALIVTAIAKSMKFCLAWDFAVHVAKTFHRLPPHLQPPGWSGHNPPQP